MNKKFIIFRDVIFIESSKTENVVEWYLDCLNRFRQEKCFQGFDNEIPHLEGGIPILDQSMESPSEALSPLHKAPAIDDTLSDVINIIGRLNLDLAPSQ